MRPGASLYGFTVGALALCPMMTTAKTIIPENPPAAERHKVGQVSLTVTGAFAGISTEYFEQTATDAIAASGLLSSTDRGNNTRMLEIRIIKVSAPSFSTRMEVSMNAIWELTVPLIKPCYCTRTFTRPIPGSI